MSADILSFEVFLHNLRHLCLDNFPTGLGSWRADFMETVNCKATKLNEWKPDIDSYFQITLKDNGDANLEKTEALIEFISAKKSPWLFTDNWSMEAKSLREICVKTPWLLSRSFVYGHFKTLRLIDKQITEINSEMTLLKNLEELTLSANYLIRVPSKNLPESLKVLELCANKISCLEDLVEKPPPLEHLGMGMNELTSISDYITGEYWPYLISLDMSENSLTEIGEATHAISTLPKLRYLLLKGNPFSLLPNYRGYVIDCLPGLLIFDDLRISADERFNFRGMSRKQDLMTNDISIEIQVKYIKNLPIPEEVKNPLDFPELPIIIRKYYLQLWWPSEFTKTVIPFTMTKTTLDQMENIEDEKVCHLQGVMNKAEMPIFLITSSIPQMSVSFQQQTIVEALLEDVNDQMNTNPDETTDEPLFNLEPIRSRSKNFTPDLIEVDWEHSFTRSNLRIFRDFLKKGIDIELIEDKIYIPDPAKPESEAIVAKMNMYPPNQLPQVEDPLGRKSPPGKHGAGSSKKGGAGVATSTKGSCKDQAPGGGAGKNQNSIAATGPEKKGKKGKKVEESDLAMHSKISTTLAKFQMPLEALLDTTPLIEKVLTTEQPLIATPAMPDLKPDKKTKKQKGDAGDKAKKEKGRKSAKAEKEKSNQSRPTTRGKASSKASKYGEKTKKQDSVEEPEVIPPLTEVSLSISLVKWSSTKEALKYVTNVNKD